MMYCVVTSPTTFATDLKIPLAISEAYPPVPTFALTAALGEPPPPLIEQLKVGGRLVMPVGSAYGTQQLTVVEKIADSRTKSRAVAYVRIVPFTRSQDQRR